MAIENGPGLKMENPLTENGDFPLPAMLVTTGGYIPDVIKEVCRDAN